MVKEKAPLWVSSRDQWLIPQCELLRGFLVWLRATLDNCALGKGEGGRGERWGREGEWFNHVLHCFRVVQGCEPCCEQSPASPWCEPPQPQLACSFPLAQTEALLQLLGQALGLIEKSWSESCIFRKLRTGCFAEQPVLVPSSSLLSHLFLLHLMEADTPPSAKYWAFHGCLNSKHCLLVSLPQTSKRNSSRTTEECLSNKNSFISS